MAPMDGGRSCCRAVAVVWTVAASIGTGAHPALSSVFSVPMTFTSGDTKSEQCPIEGGPPSTVIVVRDRKLIVEHVIGIAQDEDEWLFFSLERHCAVVYRGGK
jgi:hypothetical protein